LLQKLYQSHTLIYKFIFSKEFWTRYHSCSDGSYRNPLLSIILVVCEISVSHGSEYEDDSCLEYSAVQSSRSRPTASMIRAIALMTEAVRTSHTRVYFNDTTPHHIPEGCHPCCSCRRGETLWLRPPKGLLFILQMIYGHGEPRCNHTDRGKLKRKTCPSASLATTNPIWTDPGANPDLRSIVLNIITHFDVI
jgi:hypothetical protein